LTHVDVTGVAVPHLSRRDIGSFVRKVLLALQHEIRDVSVALVDDKTMRTLNRKFRHKNKTTDVLTFPGEESCEIVISVDQARRQAHDEKHSLATELRYLLLHGVLHALGYDHETDHGEMNALELELRDACGVTPQKS
jgi:probable rRNA maturation factor